MCGIVGARHDWLLARGLDPTAVMRDAVQSLAWRGPDGQGVAHAGAWWLGCARLAIGPAKSSQPVVRRGGRFVGVMNGAITNARELWTRCLPGVERRATPPNDAWLPLLAVERRDARTLHDLRGHHAYAVADVQTGELVFGRDRFGEKPFFCLVERKEGDDRLVAFASTPTALQRLGMPAPISRRRLGEWFRCGFAEELPHRFSSRRRFFALTASEPRSAGAATRGGHTAWGTLPAAPFADRRAVTPSVREALVASARRCADTCVPAALSLSGGLDSSCLAVALSLAGHRLPAYQARAAGAPPQERDAAEAVARRLDIELRPVDIGPEALAALPRLTACAGMPLGDPSILAVHALARAAASDGIRVLLGGEGADELFLGYRRHRALAGLPRAAWLQRWLPRWSMRPFVRWLRAVAATDPQTALLAVAPPAFADHVLAPALARRACWRDARRPGMHWSDTLSSVRLRDLHGYLRCDLLPKADIACMAAGVEARAPYLEGDCVELAWHHVTPGKRPLRSAFAADLPPEVLRLPKTGFSLPLDRWFRGDLPWLDLLAEPRTRQRPHLLPGGVARAVDMHRASKADLGHGLYLLVAAELFLRTQDEENRLGTDR